MRQLQALGLGGQSAILRLALRALLRSHRGAMGPIDRAQDAMERAQKVMGRAKVALDHQRAATSAHEALAAEEEEE
jgi:hypothetical protein